MITLKEPKCIGQDYCTGKLQNPLDTSLIEIKIFFSFTILNFSVLLVWSSCWNNSIIQRVRGKGPKKKFEVDQPGRIQESESAWLVPISTFCSFWRRLASLAERKSNLILLNPFAVCFRGIFVQKHCSEVSVHTQSILWETIKPNLSWLFIKPPQVFLQNYGLCISTQ